MVVLKRRQLNSSVVALPRVFCHGNLKPELVRIVEQASSLTERLGTGFLPSDPSDSDDIVNSQIEKWCQTAAKGDLEKFQKRLAWDGLTLSNVRRVLGSVRL
jgi:hypothetical protein